MLFAIIAAGWMFISMIVLAIFEIAGCPLHTVLSENMFNLFWWAGVIVGIVAEIVFDVYCYLTDDGETGYLYVDHGGYC